MTTSRSWVEQMYQDMLTQQLSLGGMTNTMPGTGIFADYPLISLENALEHVKRQRAVADAEAARHAKLQRLLELPLGGFMVFDEVDLIHVQPHIMATIRENFNIATDPQTLRVVIARVPAKSYVGR